MKKLLFIVLGLILVSGAGYWFWMLGSVQKSSDHIVELLVQQSGVQVKKSESDEWQPATSGMRVEKGWMIKTDASGLATVRFYDQGESRLDRNSEMTISEAAFDQSSGIKMKAEVVLNAGRIWSRVLRLFDIDSSYAVKTSEVVATVRGTAFGLEKNENGSVAVSVGESAVTVSAVAAPLKVTKAIAEGTVVSFASNGTESSERLISDEDRSSGWYVSNEMADQAFVKNEIERRVNELKRLDGPRPDSPLSGIAALSEKLHLSLADDATKNVLLRQYLSRRMYHLIELVQDGKTGLAAQEFTRIENDLQAQMDAKNTNTNTDYIRASVLRIALLTDDADPDNALYPFKQRVERLFESLASSSDLSKYYARLVGFDARLNEAIRMIDAKSFDGARMSLDGVKSGLENVRRDSTSILSSLSDEYRFAFEGKMSALDARLQAIQTKMDAAMHPMVQVDATSTEMLSGGQVTSTMMRIDPAEIVSIGLSATPSVVNIGQRATFKVKGKLKDGTEKDLTAFSSFESLQKSGKLNGPSYVGTSVGTDEVTARYGSLASKMTIQTKGEIKLVDLVISSSEGTNLPVGKKTVLSATARYNNGITKNVTDQTLFIVVSGGGSMNGTMFVNNGESVGDTVIAGTYKDQSLTSIGSIKITVGN